MADKLSPSPAPKAPVDPAESGDVQAFRAWIEKNGAPVLYAVLAAVVVLLACTVWQNRKRAAAEAATQALFTTQDPDALLAIADDAPSSTAAPLAILQAGALFANQNLHEEALAAFDRFLAAAPTHDFAPLAKLNRAVSLDALGRSDEALDALLEEGDPAVLSAAGLAKARIQEAKGDFAGARATYEELVASASDYPTLAQAESQLVYLDGLEAATAPAAEPAPAPETPAPAPETPAPAVEEPAPEAPAEAVEAPAEEPAPEAVEEAPAPEKPAKKAKAKKAAKKASKKAKAAEEPASEAEAATPAAE